MNDEWTLIRLRADLIQNKKKKKTLTDVIKLNREENEIIYHTITRKISHKCFMFLFFYFVSRSIGTYMYVTRDCTVKKKVSMIVCDKFDEDFACIERVRSQIDLLTVYIIHCQVILLNLYQGTISIMHIISVIERIN